MDSRESRQPFQVVLAIAALLIIATTLTLRSVAHPAVLQSSSDNPTPLGYTWSLLLFIIPIAALGWWFASRPDLKFPRRPFGVRSPSWCQSAFSSICFSAMPLRFPKQARHSRI
jgi:hypothetical protein